MDTGKKKTIIAFDVDDTLITEKFEPIYDNIWLLQSLSGIPGVHILVWSGGGQDYAQHHAEKLGLSKYVHYYADKNQQTAEAVKPDITFDDQNINLGIINIQI